VIVWLYGVLVAPLGSVDGDTVIVPHTTGVPTPLRITTCGELIALPDIVSSAERGKVVVVRKTTVI